MFKWFRKPQIDAALEGLRRQYFAGDLERPQALVALQTDKVEIGLTSYDVAFSEPAHRHTDAVEYQYMICGWTCYMDTETKEVFEFRAGDFYAIYPGTSYAQKSKAGTKILFVKVPSVRDKSLVDVDDEVERWLKDALKTTRRDYFCDDASPAANSVRPAAAVVVAHGGNVLMVRRGDSGKWSLPGGTLEHDESMLRCAVRELEEETGLHVTIEDLIGSYTDPDVKVEYSDGEVRREFTLVYYGTADERRVVLDDESTAYRWVPVDELLDLDLADSQRRRLVDVGEYLRTGKRALV